MSAVNMINNNMQLNQYATLPSVKSVELEEPKGNQVKADDNASVNEYGDEFVRSSIIKTKDGAVYSKPRGSDDNTARVPEEEELPKIDSLTGYTSSQVQRFYYEGRISRHDYDVKMEQKKELLRSEGAIANLEADKPVVSTDDLKKVEAQKPVVDDGVKVETSKAEVNRAEVDKTEANKTDADKAYEVTRQDKAGREKVYNEGKDIEKEIISDAKKNAEVLNKKMSAIDNEQRENEEFEIIESGNDSAATFRLVQNLGNLGSGVEGGTWNIA